MKNLRNLAAIVLLATLAYSCDADATLDETQANTDQTQIDLLVSDGDGGGDQQNDPDVKD